jgi:hypothetical protein
MISFLTKPLAAFLIVISCLMASNPLASEDNSSELPKLTVYYTLPPNCVPQGTVCGYDKLYTTESYLDERGLSYNVIGVSWEEGYARVIQRPNSLFIAADRTPEREDQLHWITKLGTDEYHIYGLSNKGLEMLTKQELISRGYKVTCPSFSSQCEYLIKAGFNHSQIIDDSDYTSEMRYNGLLRGRSDLTVLSSVNLSDYEIDGSKVIALFKLMNVQSYLVAGPQINEDILNKLQSPPSSDIAIHN